MTPLQKQRARRLRKDMMPSETRMWAALRNRRFALFKFRRQHVVGSYIADFLCKAARVIVELDGDSHGGKAGYDEQRRRWLEEQGYRVLRFWDADVYDHWDSVMETIYNACVERCKDALAPAGRGPRRAQRAPG